MPITFEQLIAWQAELRRTRPTAHFACETRIARALASLVPEVAVPTEIPKVHRCDLARAWCERRGIPTAWSPRALACNGVRAALALIFADLASRGERVALPRDVYPVYGELAAGAGVATIPFETFPDPSFDIDAHHVVLPCPWKLHARAWTDAEFAAASRWLAADPQRRLVLDGVYSLGEPIAASVLSLIETGQVLYLDSMSKGWLLPQLFGAALVPAEDLARLAPSFRACSPSPRELFVARACLPTATPAHVIAELDRRRAALLAHLAARELPAIAAARGYLVPVACSAEVALSRDVVTIPSSVFGSTRGDWTIASAL